MSFDEISYLLDAANRSEREGWEKVRQVCFYTVAVQSDKFKTPRDLFMFPWEQKEKKPVKTLTREQVDKKFKAVQKWLDSKTIA